MTLSEKLYSTHPNRILAIAVLFSCFLHLTGFVFFSLYIDAHPQPILCAWPNIVHRDNLFFVQKNTVLPRGVDFSTDKIRNQYFTSTFRPHAILEKNTLDYFVDSRIITHSKAIASFEPVKKTSYSFCLWGQDVIFSSQPQETVSYRAYVSPHGKILFLFPEKFAVNSQGNLKLQEHLKEATIFLNDKFLWTKLEGVVK